MEQSHPLFVPPPSDIRPHTREELRAAYRERINEAVLQAEMMWGGLVHSDEEQGVQACRNLLKTFECMRITLEHYGVEAPRIIFVSVDDE